MGKDSARRGKESGAHNEVYRLAVLDFETDPFKHGRDVKPFTVGFWDGKTFVHFWGDDCVAQVVAHINALEYPTRIYAHNGGKFDFLFLIPYIAETPRIVKGRILQASFGKHEFRDSWGILPFPLKAYAKDKIDYAIMERDVREKHRAEIVKYMKADCVYLFDLVVQFYLRFGEALTIGSMAIRTLAKHHPFERLKEAQDDFMREFNFGGRTQCFKTGIVKGKFKVYDVNAMYPHVMATFDHPISSAYQIGDKITPDTCFVSFAGRQDGAFPKRTPDGLNFNIETGVFHVNIHELRAAEDLGLVRIDRIVTTVDFYERSNFSEFIEKYHALRREAQAAGDDAGNLLYKYLPNSSYGKFGQNPDNHFEYQISKEPLPPPWQLDQMFGDYFLYKKEPRQRRYFNVATGASITGAARSLLLRGIAGATRPVYCDTDSLICENLRADIDARKLGSWKLEAEGDTIAIAGKKLYAVFLRGKCIKQASKGVRLTPDEIRRVAKGDVIEYANPVPNFKLDGSQRFISRRIRMTG